MKKGKLKNMMCISAGAFCGLLSTVAIDDGRLVLACPKVDMYRQSSLQERAVNGEKVAYEILSDSIDGVRLFYYSTVMSLQYRYAPAFYDAYCCITDAFKNNKNLGDIDSTSWHTAVDFLEQGKALGNDSCIVELERLKKNGLLGE